MNAADQLIRRDLSRFSGYRSARKESSISGTRLNANENPWGPLNRYPEQQPDAMLSVFSQYYGVDKNQMVITRGSGEGIDCIMRLFCEAYRSSILITPPTFGLYAVSAKLQGADVLVAEKTADLNCLLGEMRADTKLVFLCSPNNPTGEILQLEDIASLCRDLRGRATVVVDEAYIEFSNARSASSLLDQYDNLIVLRTLSKAFGLAAARVGVIFSHPALAQAIKTILAPYPIPQSSIDVVLDAFSEKSLVRIGRQIKIIISERKRVENTLKQLPIIRRVWPSQGNFCLVQFKYDVKTKCDAIGIVIRDMSQQVGQAYCARISIGSPEENDRLLRFLGGMK